MFIFKIKIRLQNAEVLFTKLWININILIYRVVRHYEANRKYCYDVIRLDWNDNVIYNETTDKLNREKNNSVE